jgi:hypothetical protein
MAQASITPNSPSFVKVILRVDNTGGGTAKPQDFDINISGDNYPAPTHFSGSQNGTIVAMTGKGSYSVSVTQNSGSVTYGKSYSEGCHLNTGPIVLGGGSGGSTIKDGEKQTCIVTMVYPIFK